MERSLFYQIPGTIQELDFSLIGLHWSVLGDDKFMGLKKSWDLIRVDFSGVFLYRSRELIYHDFFNKYSKNIKQIEEKLTFD